MIQSKEWWIELKNMCAWEINAQLPAHRPAVRVIEKSAYDVLLKQAEAMAKVISYHANGGPEQCAPGEWVQTCESSNYAMEALTAWLSFKGEL